jgi:hypothetical protein
LFFFKRKKEKPSPKLHPSFCVAKLAFKFNYLLCPSVYDYSPYFLHAAHILGRKSIWNPMMDILTSGMFCDCLFIPYTV